MWTFTNPVAIADELVPGDVVDYEGFECYGCKELNTNNGNVRFYGRLVSTSTPSAPKHDATIDIDLNTGNILVVSQSEIRFRRKKTLSGPQLAGFNAAVTTFLEAGEQAGGLSGALPPGLLA